MGLLGLPTRGSVVVHQGGFYEGDRELDLTGEPWLDEGDQAVLFLEGTRGERQ